MGPPKPATPKTKGPGFSPSPLMLWAIQRAALAYCPLQLARVYVDWVREPLDLGEEADPDELLEAVEEWSLLQHSQAISSSSTTLRAGLYLASSFS